MKAGRRWRVFAPLLLLVQLLLGPLFVLAPLALLLLVSAVPRLRDAIWTGAIMALVLLWLPQSQDLSERTRDTAALMAAGTFTALTVASSTRLFTRAMVSVAVAMVGTIGWFVTFGYGWSDLAGSVRNRPWAPGALRTPEFGDNQVLGRMADGSAVTIHGVFDVLAMIYPALLAVSALAGLWSAWYWYHRLSSAPIGLPALRFRDFIFSDHLVWVLVVALAGTLTSPQDSTVWLVAVNLLVVMGGCYFARGLAVAITWFTRAPRGIALVAGIIALPLLHFAMVACALVGVSDTWLDLRRRMASPEGVTS